MPAILSGELRAMSDEALQDKLEELKQDMLTMRLNYSIGELTDTSEFKKARRTIARIETIMREREHAAQDAPDRRSPFVQMAEGFAIGMQAGRSARHPR